MKKKNDWNDLIKYLNSLKSNKKEAERFKNDWKKMCEKENKRNPGGPFEFYKDIWNF